MDCLDVSLDFEELFCAADTFAKALTEFGVCKQDIVVVATPNYYQSIVAFMAANKIGAVVTFLNSRSTLEEIKEYLNKYEAPLFINCDVTEEDNAYVLKNTKVKKISPFSELWV